MSTPNPAAWTAALRPLDPGIVDVISPARKAAAARAAELLGELNGHQDEELAQEFLESMYFAATGWTPAEVRLVTVPGARARFAVVTHGGLDEGAHFERLCLDRVSDLAVHFPYGIELEVSVHLIR